MVAHAFQGFFCRFVEFSNSDALLYSSRQSIKSIVSKAVTFRATAEGETGHAHGHLDCLAHVGDPATDLPIGSSENNLKVAVAGETHEYTDMHPGMAKSARSEGFKEIADEGLQCETETKTAAAHFLRFELTLEVAAALKYGLASRWVSTTCNTRLRWA